MQLIQQITYLSYVKVLLLIYTINKLYKSLHSFLNLRNHISNQNKQHVTLYSTYINHYVFAQDKNRESKITQEVKHTE